MTRADLDMKTATRWRVICLYKDISVLNKRLQKNEKPMEVDPMLLWNGFTILLYCFLSFNHSKYIKFANFVYKLNQNVLHCTRTKSKRFTLHTNKKFKDLKLISDRFINNLMIDQTKKLFVKAILKLTV